jgi:N utilization substance protein B
MSSINALAAQRRRARHFALQGLYQWSMTQANLAEIEAEFRIDNDFSHVDGEYYRALLTGVVSDACELDSSFEQLLDRTLDELDPIERSLLRLGTFELKERIDVPYKVVINESVALAKKFGATDSYRYINGVLDKVARNYRQIEINTEA